MTIVSAKTNPSVKMVRISEDGSSFTGERSVSQIFISPRAEGGSEEDWNALMVCG